MAGLVDQAWDELGGEEGTSIVITPHVQPPAIKRAQRRLRDARAVDPDDLRVLTASCTASAIGGDFPAAHRFCEDAVKRYSASSTAQTTLDTLLIHEGRFQEAVAYYRRATELAPTASWAFTSLAYGLLLAHSYESALVAAKEAVDLDPHVAMHQTQLGAAQVELCRFDDALLALRTAVEIDPRLPTAHAYMGTALAGLGQREKAANAFVRSLDLDPLFDTPFNTLISSFTRFGRATDAFENVRLVAVLRPDNPHVHVALCWVLTEVNRPAEAVEACRKAITLRSAHFPPYLFYSYALLKLGRRGEARGNSLGTGVDVERVKANSGADGEALAASRKLSREAWSRGATPPAGAAASGARPAVSAKDSAR